LKRRHWTGSPRVLVDVVVPGELGGRQWRKKPEKQAKHGSTKPGSQQDQMEEFHGCLMLEKELQELMMK
jgi:hypothetical protein